MEDTRQQPAAMEMGSSSLLLQVGNGCRGGPYVSIDNILMNAHRTILDKHVCFVKETLFMSHCPKEKGSSYIRGNKVAIYEILGERLLLPSHHARFQVLHDLHIELTGDINLDRQKLVISIKNRGSTLEKSPLSL